MSWFYEHELKVSSKGSVKKLFHILFYGLITGVFVDIIWTSVIWTLSFAYPTIETNHINFYQAVTLGYLIILYDQHLNIFRSLRKNEEGMN
jgi:hypothetical protein